MSTRRTTDKHLLQALTKAYTARAQLFHNRLVATNVDLLIAEIDDIPRSGIKWNIDKLGITSSAFRRVKQTGATPHQVFAHPSILANRPHLISYYRNLATISQKGIGQILFSTASYERKRASQMAPEDAEHLSHTLNTIISGVIDATPHYEVSISRKAILAEIGAEIQGTWANMIGKGASNNVEKIVSQHIQANRLGQRAAPGKYKLANGWSIIFGIEPDVAFFDPHGIKRIAIEIKGSLDVAGAQTRYGEAKKSFAKQLAENPRCHTVYLASCFTEAVIQQIRTDGQVRDWFNLTSIIYDDQERGHFLSKIFHVVHTPAK